jgi:hypothetical protein
MERENQSESSPLTADGLCLQNVGAAHISTMQRADFKCVAMFRGLVAEAIGECPSITPESLKVCAFRCNVVLRTVRAPSKRAYRTFGPPGQLSDNWEIPAAVHGCGRLFILHTIADRSLVNIQADVIHTLPGKASLVSLNQRPLSSALAHHALLLRPIHSNLSGFWPRMCLPEHCQ